MKSRLERNGGGSWARLPWSEEADSGTLVSRGALTCLGVWRSGFRGSTAHQPGLLMWDPQPGAGRKRGGQPPFSHVRCGLPSTPLRQPRRLPFAC